MQIKEFDIMKINNDSFIVKYNGNSHKASMTELVVALCGGTTSSKQLYTPKELFLMNSLKQ